MSSVYIQILYRSGNDALLGYMNNNSFSKSSVTILAPYTVWKYGRGSFIINGHFAVESPASLDFSFASRCFRTRSSAAAAMISRRLKGCSELPLD
jgi:hypothetical protein